MFIENKYKKIYFSIIENAKDRINIDYIENHHIIPKSLGGNNKKENIIKLTAREHFICHWLLTKMTKDNDMYKMIYAFNGMCAKSKGQERYFSSRGYDIARKLYSFHHPTKNKAITNKISKSLILYYRSERYIENQKKRDLENKIEVICICGCNTLFLTYKSRPALYLNENHYFSVPRDKWKEEDKQNLSKIHKERLAKLSKEEMLKRINKSLRSCDEKQRGKSISLGKKGKKTNQQEIMGKRYAELNQEEFEKFLLSISPKMKQRSINLRNKYV